MTVMKSLLISATMTSLSGDQSNQANIMYSFFPHSHNPMECLTGDKIGPTALHAFGSMARLRLQTPGYYKVFLLSEKSIKILLGLFKN